MIAFDGESQIIHTHTHTHNAKKMKKRNANSIIHAENQNIINAYRKHAIEFAFIHVIMYVIPSLTGECAIAIVHSIYCAGSLSFSDALLSLSLFFKLNNEEKNENRAMFY